jgi:hypothetical protein
MYYIIMHLDIYLFLEVTLQNNLDAYYTYQEVCKMIPGEEYSLSHIKDHLRPLNDIVLVVQVHSF